MTDIMRQQMMDTRREYHAGLTAVEEIDNLDFDRETAMANLHSILWNWGSRILPRDTDELPDYAREDHGEHSNVLAAWQAELSDRDLENPADIEVLEEIGDTLERMIVLSLDLHPSPPVVDAYQPAPPEDTRARVNELIEETPGLSVEGEIL